MLTPKNCLSAVVVLFFLVNFSFAQSSLWQGQRAPITAAPFLSIAPDARTAGLGEAGVALSADANAAYWNPAKLALLPERSNFSFSYTPWLSKVVSNMNLYHFSAAQKLDKKNALGISVTYFDLGDMQFTNKSGSLILLENPYGLSIALSYARSLSKAWSIGGSAKYIGNSYAGTNASSGNPQSSGVPAIDLGTMYQKELHLFQQDAVLNVGINLANLGPKTELLGEDYFLPANLSLGTSLSTQLHPDHKLSWLISFSKLLAPTPPIYEVDENGMIVRSDPNDPNSPLVIAAGKDPDRSWFSGTFGSFTDAPDGFSEELKEFRVATGLEYGFREFVAVRAGYYHESQEKGYNRYFTTGLGLRYRAVSLDLAYLFPDINPWIAHPLENTLKIGLQLRF